MQNPLKPATIVDSLMDREDRNIVIYRHNLGYTVSFAQLYQQVTQAVSLVKSAGISAESRVGVIAENGYEALLIDLVLLKIGSTTVQVPEATAAGTINLLGENRLSHIITTSNYKNIIDARDYTEVVTVNNLFIFENKTQSRHQDVDLSGTPAIIFSSGTSGKVKKLLVSAPAIIYHANAFFSTFKPEADDLFLIFLPLSNYQQKLLIYGCILSGINFCLTDVVNVLGALKRVKPTVFLAPPIFYEAAWKLSQMPMTPAPAGDTEAPDSSQERATERLKDYFGGNIRIAWSGMAPIPRNILKSFQSSGVPLYEAYGMTEYGPITANTPSRNRTGSVGVAIVPGSVYIAHDDEIMVRSKLPLTTGYLDESASDEKIVYVDVETIATGDIGYFDDDGYLFIRGRKKDILITSSGHKIHPQIVEHAFHDIPQVAHTILMGNGQPHLGVLVIVKKIEAETKELISQRICQLNAGVCRLFPIRKWCVREGVFSPENGMLTRNLKLNRGNIVEMYQEAVFS
jgi:long-subunit acyl-CoA synthetase (AMP-forming)